MLWQEGKEESPPHTAGRCAEYGRGYREASQARLETDDENRSGYQEFRRVVPGILWGVGKKNGVWGENRE